MITKITNECVRCIDELAILAERSMRENQEDDPAMWLELVKLLDAQRSRANNNYNLASLRHQELVYEPVKENNHE